jgi:predicted nucleotidyltransferase
LTADSTREGVDLSLTPVIATLFRVADVIKVALQPRTEQIIMAFRCGSVAKAQGTTNSDIDLMVISDELAYAEVMELLFVNDVDGIFSTHRT